MRHRAYNQITASLPPSIGSTTPVTFFSSVPFGRMARQAWRLPCRLSVTNMSWPRCVASPEAASP